MNKSSPKTVDEYISAQAVFFQETLEKLRFIIKSEAPQAEELISYQIPCFKYLYMLVSFGVTKKTCSFYTMSPDLVSKIKKHLKDQKYSGATLYFTPGEPLPEALIRKIVRARVTENQLRAKKK